MPIQKDAFIKNNFQEFNLVLESRDNLLYSLKRFLKKLNLCCSNLRINGGASSDLFCEFINTISVIQFQKLVILQDYFDDDGEIKEEEIKKIKDVKTRIFNVVTVGKPAEILNILQYVVQCMYRSAEEYKKIYGNRSPYTPAYRAIYDTIDFFIRDVNEIFQQGNIPFSFIKNDEKSVIIPIRTKEAEKAINKALLTENQYLQSAVSALQIGTPPDYRGCISHCVSALEVCIKNILGKPKSKDNLKKLIDTLKSEKKIKYNKLLDCTHAIGMASDMFDGLQKISEFSNEKGARHGTNNKDYLVSEAELILCITSSYITYLSRTTQSCPAI